MVVGRNGRRDGLDKSRGRWTKNEERRFAGNVGEWKEEKDGRREVFIGDAGCQDGDTWHASNDWKVALTFDKRDCYFSKR